MAVDKLVDSTQLDGDLTSVANSIRTKSGKNGALAFPTDFVSEITELPVSDDVLFIDYEGTVLHSYSKAQFLAMAALPSNPSHTGLTAQGWNWSLSDAKTYVTNHDRLVIGQNYITSDGATRIYVNMETYPYAKLCFIQSESFGVTIDWGDDSAENSYSGTGNITATHTYEEPGEYVITLTPVSGTLRFGHGNSSTTLYGDSSSVDKAFGAEIRKIEVGTTGDMATYALYQCLGIEEITMPSSLRFWGAPFGYCVNLKCVVVGSGATGASSSGTFSNCYLLEYVSLPNSYVNTYGSMFSTCLSLKRIHFPDGITSLPNSVCADCNGIKYATYSNSLTSLGNYAFQSCYALVDAKLPSTVTSIGATAFSGDRYAFEEVTIPSGITQTDAFNAVRTLRKVTFPSSLQKLVTKAFQNCRALKEVIIPTTNSLSTIESFAFQSCYVLSTINLINTTITSVTEGCFQDCWGLIYAQLPSTVTSIGANAFKNTSSLIVLAIAATMPPTLDATAFTGSTVSAIHVPAASENAYKAAWPAYASIIVGD